jgi:DNA polymerase-1
MHHLVYGPEGKQTYKICILVNDIHKDKIEQTYITPYKIAKEEVIVISLHQSQVTKKTSAAEQKAYITEELGPTLLDLGVEYLIVGDGDYFKTLTKSPKVDPVLGYVLDTEYGPWKVVYVPNYRAMFHDPAGVTKKVAQGINALKSWVQGTYREPGTGIIEFGAYPQTVDEIADWLERLLEMDRPLAIDIEGFSLKHYDAGIGTISFAWSKTEGVAFPVDILDDPEHSAQVRELLRNFFWRFKQKAIYHRIAYDVYVLIYQLFMKHILDNEGLLLGLEIMLRNWDDTILISYLATNSCGGNTLGLKSQAQEYAGDYAQENIKQIRNIPLPELLQYNLGDTLSTMFLLEKHWDTMVADQQLGIYETIFKPAIKDIIQMQLTGMPIDIEQVARVKEALMGINSDAVDRIQSSSLVQGFRTVLANEWATKRNQELKKKRVTPNDFKKDFNPNSGPQLGKLLYEVIGLPVLDYTDTKLPATGGDTLKKLLSYTEDPAVKELLNALMDFKAVEKILSSFIPSLENSRQGPDGWHWLFGFFNLGGTVSGRLSSSGPNLQNLPANVVMTLHPALLERYRAILAPFVKDGKLSLGKLIKSCFMAPPGWFFCGIDFASLEDRISALTTKDPNKLKVYTDGYDGHCLRAYAYFGDKMPDIDPNSVESINSIAKKYPDERQTGKNPTFALTYQGTFKTLMSNYNFSEQLAKKCESAYQVLYKVSVDWVNAKLDQACKDGYITAAFGLRVRTPMLHQVIRGTSKTPSSAEAEGRTAGNALGQSWCLLNTRAGSEFLGKVRASEYRHSIKPCAQIHDAQYYLVRDDIDAIQYANTNVVIACQWQDHPDIWHDEVKLGGEFGIFYPNWSKEVTLPNGASQADIYAAFEKHVAKLAA